MFTKLFTIGFAGKSAEEFFSLLSRAGVQHLVDIRENRVGQLAGFAKYPDIAFFLDRLVGIEYLYEPLLAPSPEIRQAYRKTKDWEQYEKSFLALMDERKILERIDPSRFDRPGALLCSEPGPERCHRRLVAEMLKAHWSSSEHPTEVVHLVVDRPHHPPTRKTKRHARVGPV